MCSNVSDQDGHYSLMRVAPRLRIILCLIFLIRLRFWWMKNAARVLRVMVGTLKALTLWPFVGCHPPKPRTRLVPIWWSAVMMRVRLQKPEALNGAIILWLKQTVRLIFSPAYFPRSGFLPMKRLCPICIPVFHPRPMWFRFLLFQPISMHFSLTRPLLAAWHPSWVTNISG